MDDLFSGIFLVPFLTGLAVALVLPVLGCYLRLRHEWLAALAYANVAAAGALAALVAGLPLAVGGVGTAVAAAAIKRAAAARLGQGAAFALFLIIGWAEAVLFAANMPMAERLGHALFDGQLYFTDSTHLALAVLSLAVVLPALARLSRRLLLAQIYPHHFRLRGLATWPVHLGFDLLVVVALAVATMSLGVMGAFALAFVPAWVAFARAPDWRRGLAFALATGPSPTSSPSALPCVSTSRSGRSWPSSSPPPESRPCRGADLAHER